MPQTRARCQFPYPVVRDSLFDRSTFSRPRSDPTYLTPASPIVVSASSISRIRGMWASAGIPSSVTAVCFKSRTMRSSRSAAARSVASPTLLPGRYRYAIRGQASISGLMERSVISFEYETRKPRSAVRSPSLAPASVSSVVGCWRVSSRQASQMLDVAELVGCWQRDVQRVQSVCVEVSEGPEIGGCAIRAVGLPLTRP